MHQPLPTLGNTCLQFSAMMRTNGAKPPNPSKIWEARWRGQYRRLFSPGAPSTRQRTTTRSTSWGDTPGCWILLAWDRARRWSQAMWQQGLMDSLGAMLIRSPSCWRQNLWVLTRSRRNMWSLPWRNLPKLITESHQEQRNHVTSPKYFTLLILKLQRPSM